MKKRRKGKHPRVKEDAQTFYNELWEVEPRARHSVAPNPVSLEKFHLSNLARTHLCAEKNDGVRCLLLMGRSRDDGEEPYVMRVYRNRDMDEVACLKSEASVEIPLGDQTVQVALYDGTLLDGEFVEATNEFIAFDAVAVGGYDVKVYPLESRLRSTAAAVHALPPMPFTVRCKDFQPVSEAVRIFESAENCDGLVFMPKSEPVRTGRHVKMYKWKVLDHCTIDLAWDGSRFYAIGDRGKKEYTIPFKTPEGSQFITNAIYELAPSLDSPWKVVRHRTDKVAPNHIVTIHKTMKSIRDNISLDDIMDVV